MTLCSRAVSRRSLPMQSGMGTVVVVLSMLATAGCWSSQTDAPRVSSAAESSQELVGGFPANSSQFNAVGSLTMLYMDPFGGPYPGQVCTATLVDQDTVLTAKHCIEAVRYSPGTTLTFGLGPSTAAPSATSDVIAYQLPPGDPYGGFTGMGRDLAVVQLDEPIADAPTAGLATIGEDDVGDRLATFGYGDQYQFGGVAGTRQVGGVTVQAVAGRIYELLFGDFETFHEWYTGMPVPPECVDVPAIPPNGPVGPIEVLDFNCLNTAFAKGTYESTVLEAFDEVYVGGAEGDAQPCYGDSGGPLVSTDAEGDLVVHGVVSGSVYTPDGSGNCGNGAVYAGLSAETIEFIETAAAWEDPCEVDTTQGVCDGTVARRCTALSESGERRELSFDCASVGATCQTQQNGAVGCGEDDSSFGPPSIEGGVSVVGVPGPVAFPTAFQAPGEGAPAP